MENGEPEGQSVLPATQLQQHGHGYLDEADGVHDHAPLQGRLVQVQGGVADEDEDDRPQRSPESLAGLVMCARSRGCS